VTTEIDVLSLRVLHFLLYGKIAYKGGVFLSG
jgi:hypothetical protein